MAETIDSLRKKMQTAQFSQQETARVMNLINSNQIQQAGDLIKTTLSSKKPAQTQPTTPISGINTPKSSVGPVQATNIPKPLQTQGISGNKGVGSPAPIQNSVNPVNPVNPVNKYGTTVDIGNVANMRANQTPEERAWQAKQDAFDAANPPGTRMEDIVRPETQTPTAGATETKTETAPEPTKEKIAGTGEEYNRFTNIIKGAIANGKSFEEGLQMASEAFGTNVNQRNYEILANLQQGYANAPQLFQDFNTFKEAYGYDKKPENEKRVLESFFKSKGGKIPGAKVTSQEKAQLSFNNDINLYSGLSAGELADAINTGKVTIGSDVYNQLKAQDPKKVQDAEMINTLKLSNTKNNPSQVKVEANVGSKIVSDIPKVEIPSFQKMLSDNQDVNQSLDKARGTKSKIDALTDQLENLEDEITKRYEGSGATTGYIAARVAMEAKDLMRQLNTLNRQYSNEMSDVEYYSSIVKEEYNTKKDLAEFALKEQSQMSAEERAFARQKEFVGMETAQAKEMATFKVNLENQALEARRVMEEGDIQSSDPNVRRTAIENGVDRVLSQYKDITMRRSREQIVSDIENMVNKGADLGTAISENLIKPIQEKPEFVLRQQAMISAMIPKQERFNPDVQKIGDNKYGYFDQSGSLIEIPAGSQPGTVNMVSQLGRGVVTGYGGAYDGGKGLDIGGAGKEGSPIQGFSGKVLQVNQGNPMFGNNVVIEDANGMIIRFSHLKDTNVNPGDMINGQSIGTLGSTGNSTGPHIDIRVTTQDGKTLSSQETEQYLRNYPVKTAGVIGTSGAPLAYEKAVYNMIPMPLKSSDEEKRGILKDIQTMAEAGYSPQDAMLTMIGIDVTKMDDTMKNKIFDYVSKFSKVNDKIKDTQMVDIANSVYKGDTKSLDQQLNREIDAKLRKDIGDEIVTSSQITTAKNEFTKIMQLIARNENKIGPVAGRFSDLLNKVSSDPDYQTFKTLLSQEMAQNRRAFGGTAITSTEMDAIADFVNGKSTMPIGNLKALLGALFNTVNDKYNTQGDLYGRGQTKWHITDQGAYTEEELQQEINRAISEGVPKESIARWLQANNISVQ